MSHPGNQTALQNVSTGMKKPATLPMYLDDVLDNAVAYFQAAGIDTYEWTPY